MEIVLLLVGVAFAAIGLLVIVSARQTSASGRRYDGEVAGYVPSTPRKGSPTYAPVLTFRHPREGRCFIQHSVGSGALTYAIGTKIRVVVTDGEPMRGRLDSNGLFWFGGVFLALGLIATIIFFATFKLTFFSLVMAAAVGAGIAAQVRRVKGKMTATGGVDSIIRKATSGEVIPESAFDRSTLMPESEVDAMLQRQPRQAVTSGIVILLLGAAALTWSWFWVGKRFAFLERAVATEGAVVEMARSSGKTTTWAPIVEFTPQGRWDAVRFRHSVSSSNPSWRVGDRVRVLYDPDRPENAMIDGGTWNRVTPFFPGAAGALLLLLGGTSIRSGMRKRSALQNRLTPVIH